MGASRRWADLIRHMFSAEKRYIDRLSGRALTDTASVPNDNVEALFQFSQLSRKELKEFLAAFPAEGLDVPEEHKMGKNVLTATPRKIVVHILLHETRHWAQIATFVAFERFGVKRFCGRLSRFSIQPGDGWRTEARASRRLKVNASYNEALVTREETG